jgi:hypothetical protein
MEHTMEWQLLQLEYQGYTIIPNAIPPELLSKLRRRFDELIASYEDVPTSLLHPQTNAIDLNRLFELDPVFEELMDLPSVFPIAAKVFEGDIELLGSAIGNYTPSGAGSRGGWHHDGKNYIRFTFFLSDLTEAEGPTAVLPGSHHLDRFPPAWTNDEDGNPRELPGMLPVTGAAGTCLINNTLIWHTGTPNRSQEPRRIVWVVYKHSSWETTAHEHLRYTKELAERQTSETRRKLCGLEK